MNRLIMVLNILAAFVCLFASCRGFSIHAWGWGLWLLFLMVANLMSAYANARR